MHLNVRGLAAVAAIAFSVVATPAVAQVCVGVPLGVGQTSLDLRAHFPDGANIFGARAANQFSESLAVGAFIQHADVDGGDSQQAIGADVVFDLPIAALQDAGASLCAAGGVSFTFQDDPRFIEVPFGVGLGASFDVGDGMAVVPYAFPHLSWQRVSFDGFSDSDTDFVLDLGANLIVDNLYFGIMIDDVIRDHADTTFGVRAGIIF